MKGTQSEQCLHQGPYDVLMGGAGQGGKITLRCLVSISATLDNSYSINQITQFFSNTRQIRLNRLIRFAQMINMQSIQQLDY